MGEEAGSGLKGFLTHICTRSSYAVRFLAPAAAQLAVPLCCVPPYTCVPVPGGSTGGDATALAAAAFALEALTRQHQAAGMASSSPSSPSRPRAVKAGREVAGAALPVAAVVAEAEA